jgi:hypothetical protein
MNELLENRTAVPIRDYIDNQIQWVVTLQNIQFKAEAERTRVYSEVMDHWKTGHNEWKTRMEELTKSTVTRREAWIFIAALGTWSLTIIGLLILIWTKIK